MSTPARPTDQAPPAAEPHPNLEAVEGRSEHLRRLGHGTRLYVTAATVVALLVVVIALAAANTRHVKISWIVGRTHVSLVWIILASVVLGWLLGITTSVAFRFRTRRRHI